MSVLGVDPAKPTRAWRERIGLVLQESELEPTLTVRETVTMFSDFYPSPRGVDDTIELVGLAEKSDARVGRLSGGQRRRADVAVALIGDPDLLFLDEPTTGFEPLGAPGRVEHDRGAQGAWQDRHCGDVRAGHRPHHDHHHNRLGVGDRPLQHGDPLVHLGCVHPIDQLPDSLVQLGRVFPLAHLATGLQGTFAGGSVQLSGENVGVLALWGAVGIVVAARSFRWEPHQGGS